MNYFLSRIKEPSSYAGVATILTAAATQLIAYPKVASAFLCLAAICGAMAFALKEKNS